MAIDAWRPSASLQTLRARAELYGSVRAFFGARGVLEVDTPVLSAHATVDRHIESFSAGGGWLQTSPEFAMKRLLCAGSGPIFQIAPVFRREEQGRHHNPEFRLLEWYRPDWDHHRLMDEVQVLVAQLAALRPEPFQRLSYREAFQRHAGVDPFDDPIEQLLQRARESGFHAAVADGLADAVRDSVLDVLMSLVVGPQLGVEAPCFVFDFPASQAALARVRPGPPPVAERFELFWRGIELANGFHELADADEQQRRFESDQAWRADQGRVVPPFDRHLIDALRHGLPDCAGVALGLDRLLMLRLGLADVSATLAFDSRRA
ncbi:MAG: EF-P lysine aminoacylase EpmA [Panacagrimonas sp.]